MTVRILLVGGVPESVENGISTRVAAISGSICKAPETEPPESALKGADLVVLHASSSTGPERIQEWQHAVHAAGLRMALTVEGVLDARVGVLLFHPSVHPVLPLNHADGSISQAAVDALLQHVVEPDLPTGGDQPIGRFFRSGGDYRTQRFLSLASVSMSEFLNDLRDAVEAMSAPIPGPGPQPPWDPQDGGTSTVTGVGGKRRLGPGLPNLGDVFMLHQTGEARRLLRKASAGPGAVEQSWDPPHLLVRGESGSGKTLVAELVHELLVARTAQPLMPFVPVNCAALSSQNLDHELFGTAPGVFTGIAEPVVGLLARAAYGVAFLDEIGDLELSAQKRLLTFLGDGLIRPFQIPAYPGFVRVVAATNRDIPHLVDQQLFRNDLNERFQKQVVIPPLRDRDPTEIEWLIDFVALNPERNRGLQVTHLGRDALEALLRHEYRNGNFRELETVVHDGIGRAIRRGSPCLRRRDLSFPEARTVADSEARVVQVVAFDDLGMPHVMVRDRREMQRVAQLSGSPILQSPDGSWRVVTTAVVYSLATDGQQGRSAVAGCAP